MGRRAAIALGVLLFLLTACKKEEPAFVNTASTTAGRFAGHAGYADVGPAYPGARPVGETKRYADDSGCPSVSTQYVSDDSPATVMRYYQLDGFKGSGPKWLETPDPRTAASRAVSIALGTKGGSSIEVRRWECPT